MFEFVSGIFLSIYGLFSLIAFILFVGDLPREHGNRLTVGIVCFALILLMCVGYYMFHGLPD